MARSDVTAKLELTSEDLLKALDNMSKEMKKTMATISTATANMTESEESEDFSLSGLDYEELLETYGEDPVLMTIFNRMRDFFREPDPNYYKFKTWPPGSSGTDPSKYLRWDSTTGIDTTSVVSDTFTVKYDTVSSDYSVSGTTTPKYIISE